MSLIEPSISLQFLQRLAGLLLRRQGKNQTAVAYGMACSRMSNSSAVTEVAVLLYPLCERGQKNKTNNESLKGPRSLTASEISQTLKLKKETFRKSTAPVIYKHNGDRELLVGAGAEGRSKTTSDLSVHMHTHTHTHRHTLKFTQLTYETHLLTGRDTHVPPKDAFALRHKCLPSHSYAQVQSTD